MNKKAIVEFDGTQFSCAEGDVITVNHIDYSVGESILLGKVIATLDGDTLMVAEGSAQSEVHALVEEHVRLPKVVVRKYRRRKSSRSHYVHRQPATRLKITAINL